MNVQRGEVTCLMCGTVVGHVLDGRFAHHEGCERTIRYQGRLPRCCRCGGSLYLDHALQQPRYGGLEDLRKASVLDV